LEMSELVTQEVYKIGGGGATQAKRGSWVEESIL
jgi:hypothetical protein